MGGMLFDDVWKNLAESTRNKALYAVREGIENGLTTAQIVNELQGKRTKMQDGSFKYVGGIVEEVRKNGIEANVRTIRSTIANETMKETYKALGFEYVKFLSTLDFRTTKLCASLDQTVWHIDDPNLRTPPLHYRCRSILVSVRKDGNLEGKRPFVASDKPVSKIPKDQRAEITGQVNADTSFQKWLDRQPKQFQEEYLGKTNYKLYKDGGYTMDRFVDELGKPYTIAELRDLDSRTFKELGL